MTRRSRSKVHIGKREEGQVRIDDSDGFHGGCEADWEHQADLVCVALVTGDGLEDDFVVIVVGRQRLGKHICVTSKVDTIIGT